MQQIDNDPEMIVRQYVQLGRLTSRGWCPVKCRICNDYRARGGFKFEQGGMTYNCFNCGLAAVFIPNEHNSVPDKMLTVFDSFGIPKSDFNSAIFQGFVKRSSSSTKGTEDKPSIPLVYNNLTAPAFFKPLVTDGSGDLYDELGCEYLIARGIDPTSYPFISVDKDQCNTVDWIQWKGRIVIPYYRNNNLIFYQGRDMLNTDRTKYMSPKDSRDTVFYGYDELFSYTEKPLYIHEGFFDAFLVKDSVATFSNKFSEHQIEILNRCPRPKVVIPDRAGKGYLLANEAVKQGWSISFPDIGSSCKDMNDAILKYGRLYVLKSIVDNTTSGFAAETLIKMHCKE